MKVLKIILKVIAILVVGSIASAGAIAALAIFMMSLLYVFGGPNF